MLLREIRAPLGIRDPRATYVVNRRRPREKRYPVEGVGAGCKPRTPTVMSSARLLVVRRAFLLDARWTMAKKTLSYLLALFPTLPYPHSLSPPTLSLSLSFFLFRVLPATFLVPATPLGGLLLYTRVCWLSYDDTRRPSR